MDRSIVSRAQAGDSQPEQTRETVSPESPATGGGESGASVGQATAPAEAVLEQPAPRRVFVVHGRNHAARDAVSALLTCSGIAVVSMEDAYVQARKASPAPTVWQVVEAGMKMADAIVVVLTGDDRAQVRARFCHVEEHGSGGACEFDFQPRQNVIYECGAIAREQIPRAYVQIGRVHLPSDLQTWTLHYDGSPDSLRALRNGLAHALQLPLPLEGCHEGEVERLFQAALRAARAGRCELNIWCRRLVAVALGALLAFGGVVASGFAALIGEHEFQWAGERWLGRLTVGWPTGKPGSASIHVSEVTKVVDANGNSRFETRPLFWSEGGTASWSGLGIEIVLPIHDARPERATARMRCTRIRLAPGPTWAFYALADYDIENGETHQGDMLLTQAFASLRILRRPGEPGADEPGVDPGR